MAKILLLNCGSSSIKYQLLDPEVGEPEAAGIVQRIGQETSMISHTVGGEKYHEELPLPDHSIGVAKVVEMFTLHGPSLADVTAVGHRAVHGGMEFVEPTVITDEVIQRMHQLIPLAPLHNPPGIAGIEGAQAVFPDIPHVAIFDTAFFSDLPKEAYTYAIDRHVADRWAIRRYGFHGTSHEFVAQATANFLDTPLEELKLITAHIGNGASMTAIQDGRPIDTSMGMTPLEGLVMGTRSGDIDPGLFTYLVRTGMDIRDVDNMLNKNAGLQGLAGYTDMRDIAAAIARGDENAKLALAVYCRRIVKYVGSYMALMGGADALVFTAGVGENAGHVRAEVIRRLEGFGFKLDEAANNQRIEAPTIISAPTSSVQVLVVPTNEELAMARQVIALVATL